MRITVRRCFRLSNSAAGLSIAILLGTIATGCSGSDTGGGPGAGGTSAASGGAVTGGTTTAAGGLGATGGTQASGGAAAGGTQATGGRSSGTGGASATGGSKTTGGATATGGSKTTGGASATGGTKTTGGALATGGAGATGGASCTKSATGFVHPGLVINTTDIARMKSKIASQSIPWTGNYTTLINNNLSSTTRAYTTPPAIIGRNAASAYANDRGPCELDAVAAYQNALIYVLTGQTAHADYAVKILNAYAAGVQHFDGVDPERDLEASILGWWWVSTAELLRYSGYNYTGWAAADISKFNTWIYNVVYADTAYNATGVLVTPLPNGAGSRGAWDLRTKMGIGIYLDNVTVYKEAVDYFFNGQGNGAPQYYVNPTTGQTWEAGRDQGHAQGGLCRLMETAHMAHNQCDESLYAWGNNALARASEYIAEYNLGNDVPYSAMQPFTLSWSAVYDVISADGRGSWQPIYELPYNYWHGIKSLAMPYTLQAINAEGTETFSPQHDNPMFATLIYRL